MILYGKNSVLERLRANPKSIKAVFLREDLDLAEIEKLTRFSNIPLERVSAKKLSKIKHNQDIQGIAAKVEEFPYAYFDDLLAVKDKPTLIFLDRINDPQNLGVILRITACLGKFALVIPKFKACPITEAVLHVASGGENYTKVAMVSNLSNAIISAKKSGYWIAGGMVSPDTESISKVCFSFPLGLVLGFEGGGIRPGIQSHLDLKVHIPMPQAKLSLNVAMACAIFCYEISKQKLK